MSETVVIKRLEAALDAMPKEGLKAAIVLGVLERVREMVEEAVKDIELINCVSAGRGICKENYCDPKCGNIMLLTFNEGNVIRKHGSNAVGIEVSNDSVSFKTEDIKMSVNSDNKIIITYSTGYYDEINYDDLNDIYKNNYTIKYAMRKLGKPLRVITGDLKNCAKQNALVCH